MTIPEPPPAAWKPLRWLPLLIAPLIGISVIAIILAVGDRPEKNGLRRAARYPSPPPVTFIPPTLRPTLPATLADTLIGQPVPEFTLKTLNGEQFRLRDLKGRVVFLNFWATWCDPCREEMPALQALQDEYGAQGVLVIAVTDPTAGQNEDAIRTFLTTYHLTLTVALESDLALYNSFGVEQIPTTFILDRVGVVRFRHIGPLDAESIAGYLAALTE